MSLRQRLLDAARDLGFAHAGFCDARTFTRGAGALDTWVARGHHGDMTYMTHPDRSDPAVVRPDARTIMVVAAGYGGGPGDVARYARGRDYHAVLRDKLRQLMGAGRACVDTAPLLEREAAMRAGIGFIGKSTMAIVPGVGSFVLLGELLLDVELPPDPPIGPRCGRCTLCLDACPTAAFVAPFVLDARRCISYLTIEHRGPIPRQLRPLMGTHLFGCDRCQEVCPYNASRRPRALFPELGGADVDAMTLLTQTSGDYRRLVRGTALSRASRNQLARNAAVALGNAGDPAAAEALRAAASTHTSALVRGHALWALARLGDREALSVGLEDEDDSVRREAELATQESA